MIDAERINILRRYVEAGLMGGWSNIPYTMDKTVDAILTMCTIRHLITDPNLARAVWGDAIPSAYTARGHYVHTLSQIYNNGEDAALQYIDDHLPND